MGVLPPIGECTYEILKYYARPTLSVQSPQAPPIGSPGALPFQLDVTEDYQFAQEMRTMSRVSVATAASVTAAALTTETMSQEPSKQPSEATIPLEAKEPKSRGRPRKEQKKSGRRHEEKDLPTRRRDDSDSNGEGEGKAKDSKWIGSGNGNGTGKHGSDRESTKGGTTRSGIPKGQHSCSNAMAPKPQTVKSVLRRVSLL